MTSGFAFRGLLAVAAAVLAGCGGSDPPQSSPPGASHSPQSGAAKKTPVLKVSRDNPCSVMFPTEVGEILGVKSEMREVVDEVTCHYDFETPSKNKTAAFIELKVHWTGGRAAVMATRVAGRLLGGGSSGFEKLSGIGDEAWIAPMAAYLAFSKGDVGVEIDMRMMPGEKEKTIRLAKLIASRV